MSQNVDRAIELTILVDRDEAASLTYGAREKWLGKMAEEKLAGLIQPRPPKSGAVTRCRWKPYSRERISSAFTEWAKLHDGRAPSKADWSASRDPERRWPRASSASFRQAIAQLAAADKVSLSVTAPHRDDPEHKARLAWREARHLRRLADGRLERVHSDHPILGSPIEELAERWEPTEGEIDLIEGPDPGPYCEECFHGSGCKPADMSYWEYAVEVVGGLPMRRGGDFHATRSRSAEFGRNRQTVTAGVSAAPDVVDVDASLERYIS